MENGRRRVDIEFKRDFHKSLEEIARRKGTTVRGVIRSALASYAFLQGELRPSDGTERHLAITDMQDRVVRRINLP